jgi:hypothetical protein
MMIAALLIAACGSKEKGRPGTGSGTAQLDAAPAPVDAVPTPLDAAAPLDAPTVDAGPIVESTPTTDGVARVVLVHGELLGSEQKAIDRLRAALARGRVRGEVVDAGSEELAVARAWLDGAEPAAVPALPAAWASAPAVLIVEVRPPIGVAPRRQSGGLGGWVGFRPPSTEPVLVQRGSLGWGPADDLFVTRFTDTLALLGAAP